MRFDRPISPLPTGQNSTAATGTNGVPLGGIGTGCVELLPDGRLANSSTTNNYHRNDRIEFMPGSFLAIAASAGGKSAARFLQTRTTLPAGRTGSALLLRDGEIEYSGAYPAAHLTYPCKDLPVRVSLVAHGTVVPEEMTLSSLPAAVFKFTVENPSRVKARATLLFSWENIAGCLHGVFPDQRGNVRKIEEGGRLVGLEFLSPPGSRPNQTGAHVLRVAAPAGAEVTAAKYNTWEACGLLNPLEDTGSFAPGAWDRYFFSNSEYTGALACRLDLAPGQKQDVTWVLAWHYPEYKVGESEMAGKQVGVCDEGHQYSNHCASAREVAQRVLAQQPAIQAGIERWHNAVMSSSLPPWLSDMLINSLYVLSTNTLWARDGRYSLMETPYGPMMGTLDQRFYSSIATALFFPELEKAEMALFAETKHPADRGRVYHDLGNLRFDDPKTGTTSKKWTDLNPKFVMMALRNFQWTNDRPELERLWPAIREMMAYTRSQDSDGDGLPNNEDRSTTYDDWAFFGANSYASGIWLGALAAFRRMAALLGREEDWHPYEPVLKQAAEQFEERLWDEELGYYRLYNDDRNPVFNAPRAAAAIARDSRADAAVNQGSVPVQVVGDHPRINRDCHDGQLAGQWFADLLGLGKIARPERIRSALREVYRRNATPRGVRKGVTPDGKESANPSSSHWWSEAGQGWPGYEVAHFAAAAIHNGQVAGPLTTVRRVHKEIYQKAKLTWNQPLRWNLESGDTYGWGCDRYMNSPAVWHVLLALAGVVLNRPEQEIALRPRLAPGQTVMDLPVFTPGNWGRIRVKGGKRARRIELSFERAEPVRRIIVEAREVKAVTQNGRRLECDLQPTRYGDAREIAIVFKRAMAIGKTGIRVDVV